LLRLVDSVGSALNRVFAHMNGCSYYHGVVVGDTAKIADVVVLLRGAWSTRWLALTLKLLTLLLLEHLVLEELKVFAEYLDGKTIEIDGLTARLVDPNRLFLDLLVFEHDELLDAKHFLTERLDSHQLVIRLRLLNLKEYLEDLVVLVLDFN